MREKKWIKITYCFGGMDEWGQGFEQHTYTNTLKAVFGSSCQKKITLKPVILC